jgi:hypothetical protein
LFYNRKLIANFYATFHIQTSWQTFKRNYLDSITQRNKSKGYICDLRQTGNEYCFENKNILVGDESYFNVLEDSVYEFVITQEDYYNAYVLPQ